MSPFIPTNEGIIVAFSVFISYSTKDLSRARQIKRLLEGTGSKVFLAEYSLPPGSELGQAILGAIKECDLFLLLWSSNAKSSEWVPQEVGSHDPANQLRSRNTEPLPQRAIAAATRQR